MLEFVAIVTGLAALAGIALLYSRIGRFETRMQERFDYVNRRVSSADDRSGKIDAHNEHLLERIDGLTREIVEVRCSMQAVGLAFSMNPAPRYTPDAPHPFLHELISSHKKRYEEQLSRFSRYAASLSRISVHEPTKTDSEPYFLNGSFPGRDAATLYALVSELKPKRFLEIGSGHSTRFAARAVRDAGLETQLTVVDPEPAPACSALGCTVVARPFEEIGPEIVAALQENDILFVDGSHRCLMNSDVTVVFLDVLPRLGKGVVVHFHDVFLPWDYPAAWNHNLFNEQYLLAAMLLQQPERWEIILPNHFLSCDPELKKSLDFLWDTIPDGNLVLPQGSSFWMRNSGRPPAN